MENNTTKKIGDITARTLTIVFNPFLMPIFGLLIIINSPTIFNYLSKDIKKLLFFIVLINNGVLPFMFLSYMKVRNFISDWLIFNRGERMVPMFTSAIFYGLTVYITYKFNIPAFIKTYFVAALVMALLMGVVSFWIKASVHAAGMGSIVALIIVMIIKTHVPLLGYLITSIILTGLVMSARLWLNAHTVKEIWIGLLLGFLGTGLVLYFF
jgi:hypothetical protein